MAQVCIYSKNEKESGSNLVTEVGMQSRPRDRAKALASEKGGLQGPLWVSFPPSMAERQETP